VVLLIKDTRSFQAPFEVLFDCYLLDSEAFTHQYMLEIL